ncbi:MAG: DUF4349 domain-containing protein [Lachnospiraceae bacterium]|nr:DUF4349 domain-containing protein [Lachnospiraceae bacterium]
MIKFGKKSSLVLTAGVLAAVLCACGSAHTTESAAEAAYDAGGSYALANSAADYAYETAVEEVAEEYSYDDAAAAEGGTQQVTEAALSERKLIKTVDISLETEEYDTLMPELERRITALGGYIESIDTNKRIYGYTSDYETEYLRYTYMTVRMPRENLDEFLESVDEQTNVLNRSERVEDVTLQYVDLESHKNALVTEQDRLLALMEQAETVEDLIAIESRLSEVRYQLESMESQLRTYDNKIDYSTVYLSIDEVETYTPTEKITVGERIRDGFIDSLIGVGRGIGECVIWFITHIPYLVVWAAVIIVLLVIIHKIRKRLVNGRTKKWARRIPGHLAKRKDDVQNTVEAQAAGQDKEPQTAGQEPDLKTSNQDMQ